MSKKTILLALLIYLLAGCSATGVKVKEDNLASFVEGETTMEEVVNLLGEPTSSIRNQDGTKVLSYNFISQKIRPETFLPFVGGLVGGSDTKANFVTLYFDQSGVLQSYSTSESNMGTGMGFSAKTSPFEERIQQPRQIDNN